MRGAVLPAKRGRIDSRTKFDQVMSTSLPPTGTLPTAKRGHQGVEFEPAGFVATTNDTIFTYVFFR